MGQSRRNIRKKPPHRITRPSGEDIEEFKKLLGPALASRYTSPQLVELMGEFHIGSQLLLELYLERKRPVSTIFSH
jgi:hypothetical protein